MSVLGSKKHTSLSCIIHEDASSAIFSASIRVKYVLSTEPISSSWVVTLIIDQMREALQHTSVSTHTCTQTMTGVYSTVLTWRSATSQLKYRWAPKRWRRNLMRSPCNRTECLIWFFVFDDCVRGTGSVRRHWTGEGVKKETLSSSEGTSVTSASLLGINPEDSGK